LIQLAHRLVQWGYRDALEWEVWDVLRIWREAHPAWVTDRAEEAAVYAATIWGSKKALKEIQKRTQPSG